MTVKEFVKYSLICLDFSLIDCDIKGYESSVIGAELQFCFSESEIFRIAIEGIDFIDMADGNYSIRCLIELYERTDEHQDCQIIDREFKFIPEP